MLLGFVAVATAQFVRVTDPAAGAAINWNMISAPSTKPAIAINNVTKGVNYSFQVRAFGKLGFSDWSSSVERMCI